MCNENLVDLGKRVYVKTSASTWTSMDVSDAKKGQYYVICSANDERWAQKVESALIDVHLTEKTKSP